MLELGFKTLLAYLLGAVIGSPLVGKLRGGVDIPRWAAATPASRSPCARRAGCSRSGWMVIDAGKGWVAGRTPAGSDPSWALLSFGCVMLLFVCYTRCSNIERMRMGTENRAQRLWLLRERCVDVDGQLRRFASGEVSLRAAR